LRDPTLADTIDEYLASGGFSARDGLIHLEITEGALMDIEHGVPAMLAELGRRGYRIALDDFGTGHSSLAHLRDFPLDSVKIDKAFIRTMDVSPTDRAVVQAVIDIASASGLKVVAEGVETEEQRELLLSLKPDILAQGWLYAKALPAEEFEAWVLGQKQALTLV
jgi:sensor c-di-GMP phosphodiesterase-like protein